MNTDLPPVATPPKTTPTAGSPGPTPIKKRRPWLLYGCGGILALLVIIIATVALTVWWIQRPIKPVVLTAKEKAAVEAKLQQLNNAATNSPSAINPAKDGPAAEPDRIYVPGSRVLRLTEREVNGLLNENTDLGKSVRLEFGRDAINAYVAVPIPEDAPLLGGKMFRARGRFKLSLSDGGEPHASLEDVTIYGLSLPNAWLGGLKGENLLSDAMGKRKGAPLFKGVKSLRIEPGGLLLEVEE